MHLFQGVCSRKLSSNSLVHRAMAEYELLESEPSLLARGQKLSQFFRSGAPRQAAPLHGQRVHTFDEAKSTQKRCYQRFGIRNVRRPRLSHEAKVANLLVSAAVVSQPMDRPIMLHTLFRQNKIFQLEQR